MITIGNYFAFGIVLLISMVFFRNKYLTTTASKYYAVCLPLTILGAIIDTLRAEGIRTAIFPIWLTKSFIVLDFLVMYSITAMLALYLTAKITEHIFFEKALLPAKITLLCTTVVFTVFSLATLPFGLIYSFNGAHEYIDGPLSFIPLLILVPELMLIAIYYAKYRKRVRKTIKAAFIQSLTIAVLITIATFIYDSVSLLILATALIELIFFINFQHQQTGINSITRLHDGRSFFTEASKRIKNRKPFKAYLIKIHSLGTLKQNYGHKIGDELLYQFAFSLEKQFSDDAVFHMYGTSFAIISGTKNSEEHTNRLLEHLDAGITYMENQLTIDYTVAEHKIQDDEANADTFYEKLEHALEIAKENKENHIVYTLDLEIARLRKRYLVSRMQNITATDGFEIWFQPIHSVAKNAFSSMEVLLRLKERNGSFISPAEFIPLAEKTGQIVPITWFVIEETCKALAQAPELNEIRASINLPMILLVNQGFEAKLNAIVDGYGIPHDRISFEFTERVILDDLDVAEKNMRKLASTGYTFYLDDFGVGYSNFNCVLRLPLKTVKLDSSLTQAAEKTKENNNLVYILTDLLHDMNLNVVAEGAETSDQVELLRAYGVDEIQGYYFAKPMPLAKLRIFLKKIPK